MSTLDDLNQAAASMGGEWAKLRTTDDPPIEGKVVAFEVRDKTFEGAVVTNRKTGQPRQEWVFTLDTGNGEHTKVSLNESAQRAVSAALKEAGATAKVGDTLKIGVAENPPSDREQATYRARWTSAPASLGVPAGGANDEPF